MGIVSKAVDWAKKTAADDSHGYDQSSRWGPDYDCSSLVISAYKYAGVPLTCTYTGNMKSDMMLHGFRDVTSSVNLANGAGLIAGDVLLHEANHTAMYIGGGQLVQARINEKGKATGGQTGDQTGREIAVGGYYNYPWQFVLRYQEKDNTAHDTVADSKPEASAAADNADTYVVQSGDTLWGIAERFLGQGYLYPLLTQLNGVTAETLRPGMVLVLHPESAGKAEEDSSTEADIPDDIDDAFDAAPTGAYLLSLRVLNRGDSGESVQQMQRLLIATGYDMPKYGADGDYGEETADAVKKFQRDNKLVKHGAVDHDTAAKLLGLY